jgi:4-hydroxybenzoate polyprenyltransferase
MNDTSMELAKTLGVNGTVLGVTTLSDIEIVLKIVLLVVTIIWTGMKILDALDRDADREETPRKRGKNAKKKAIPRRGKEGSQEENS